MPERERVAALFADAWALYADAIEILDLGKRRVAAEVAWGATKRGADALILARTGREPSGTGQTSSGMRELAQLYPEMVEFRRRFREAVRELHGKCFYQGMCEPPAGFTRSIRETADFIRDATALAGL